MRPISICFSLLIFLIYPVTTNALDLETLLAPLRGADTRAAIIEQTTSSIDFLKNDGRSGILPSTTAFPNAGRLLISSKTSGVAASCSGVALNSRYFLTAAHCVCNVAGVNSSDESDCEDKLDTLSFRVFLPTFGIVETQGKPKVHDRYKPPGGIVEGSPSQIADLAVLEFQSTVNVMPIEIGGGKGQYLVLGTGYMNFAIRRVREQLGFPEGSAMQEGVFQLWRLQKVYNDTNGCGEWHSLETLCSWYTTLTMASGPDQSVTVCRGDSGAPLFRLNSEGAIVLEGITSYFSPRRDYDQCLSDSSQRNHYVDVGRYKEWLSEFKQNSPNSYEPKTCASSLFRPGDFVFFGFKGDVTLTTFNARQSARPNMEVKPGSTACTRAEEFGAYSCRLTGGNVTILTTRTGFGQLTICEG